VRWQQLANLFFEGASMQSATGFNKRDELPARRIAIAIQRAVHDSTADDSFDPVKGGLDFFGFNAKSTNAELSIDSSQEDILAVCINTNQITRPVEPPLSATNEFSRGLFRTARVASGQAVAANQEFSRLAGSDRLVVNTDDNVLDAGQRRSQ
jgi:hypothetical protein